MDEKTGIQAISRKESPMRAGKVKRQEYEYQRNGTTTLIAAQDVSNGKVVHAHLGPTRNEEDFLKSTQQVVGLYPEQDQVILLMDQLNTHMSASLVEWIATQIGFEQDLGIKGRKGILKSMDTRKAFLERADHRIRIVFTPKHCSWLNPIENWFGKLQRHVITGGIFSSVEELEKSIKEYVTFYNKCLLKPLKWKFVGFTKNKKLSDYIVQKT